MQETKTFTLLLVTCSLSLLIFSPSYAIAKLKHGFPSSIIQPEHLSLVTETSNLYTEKFYTQILDHFNYNPQSYQTFQQRYLINETNWGGAKNNYPIFVYTGNEGDIEWFAQNTGFMFETAPRFRALLVFIEVMKINNFSRFRTVTYLYSIIIPCFQHRFYGKSMPYGGSKETAYSNSTTLGYLSSTQALADYATLIIDLKKNLTATDSPVVVFGGSYGGSMGLFLISYLICFRDLEITHGCC